MRRRSPDQIAIQKIDVFAAVPTSKNWASARSAVNQVPAKDRDPLLGRMFTLALSLDGPTRMLHTAARRATDARLNQYNSPGSGRPTGWMWLGSEGAQLGKSGVSLEAFGALQDPAGYLAASKLVLTGYDEPFQGCYELPVEQATGHLDVLGVRSMEDAARRNAAAMAAMLVIRAPENI